MVNGVEERLDRQRERERRERRESALAWRRANWCCLGSSNPDGENEAAD